MFIGTDKEVLKNATGQIYQAAIHLSRASECLLAIQPLAADLTEQDNIKRDRMHIEGLANKYEEVFSSTAREVFRA